MLRYRVGALSAESVARLAELHDEVMARVTRRERYEVATARFANKGNATFREIKERLREVSPGGDACYYCERDRYRDIDHIWPKRHYPERCFTFENYVYSCTICNQDAKRDKFAVFDANGEVITFDRSYPIEEQLPGGPPVLIDVRLEDPLDYMKLDFDTGRLVPIGSEQDIKRGRFTIDLFNLDNDALIRARRQAVKSFRAYLLELAGAKATGNDELADNILEEIKALPFPSVLVEMRRQRDEHEWLPALIDGLPGEVGTRP